MKMRFCLIKSQNLIKIFFIPCLSQSLNISIPISPINWEIAEKYINSANFDDFNSLFEGINNKFSSIYDKLYASYFFIMQNIQLDQENKSSADGNSSSLDYIVKTKKGIEIDYLTLFAELAKKLSHNSKNIHIAKFHDATTNWNSFNPPKIPNYTNQSVFIDIDGFPFISNPFLGQKHKENGNFYFLIPYHKFLVNFYPENNTILPNFSFDIFTSLAKSRPESDVSFESNPFSLIHAKDGFYEIEFSLIKPPKELDVNLYFNDGKEWKKEGSYYAKLKVLSEETVKRSFTMQPELKRVRYRLTVLFKKAGDWKAKISFKENSENHEIFCSSFHSDIERNYDMNVDIQKDEKIGFTPLYPLKGLTQLNERKVLIRFAVKLKNSQISFHSTKMKDGCFEKDKEKEKLTCEHASFRFEFPSSISNGSDTSDERLIEEFVFIVFPENGRWKIDLSFQKNYSTIYTGGDSYFFDVNGSCNCDLMSSIVFPKGRKFTPFNPGEVKDYRVEPNSSVIVVNDLDSGFHLFSPDDSIVAYSVLTSGNKLFLDLIYEHEIKKGFFDKEYALTFSDWGFYLIDIMKSVNTVDKIIFFATDSEIPEVEIESDESIKKKIEEKNDYTDDIPLYVIKNVEKMIENVDYIGEEENTKSPKKEIKSDKNQQKIEILKEKALRLENEKEKLRIRLEQMEKKEKEMKVDFEKNINLLRQDIEHKSNDFSDIMDQSVKSELDDNDDEIQNSEIRINELKERINTIEKQIENDPDKKIELEKLHKQLIKEEENESVILSARIEKKIKKQEVNSSTKNISQTNQNESNTNNNTEPAKEDDNKKKKSSACLLI